MEDIKKLLEDSIISLFDNDGNEIHFETKEVRLYKAKYSSVGREAITLFLDGVPLTNLRGKKIKVLYRCQCGHEYKIHLSKYLAKEKMTCPYCRENNQDKIAWHKLYFEMRRNGLKRGYRDSKQEKKVKYDFANESEDFKTDYFRRNLTNDEFLNILPHIHSIDGVEVSGCNIEFLVAEPAKNAKHYSQYVMINGDRHRLNDINLKCQCCGKIFHITRQLKERSNNNNFSCKGCSFTNFSFAVRRYDENLTYQSQEELSFIETCKEYGVDICNGPSIPYILNHRTHFYNVDFFLPDKKMLVEIKDNHIWHRKQVESGKWEKKEESALIYSKENGLTYHILFPNDMESFIENHIKR